MYCLKIFNDLYNSLPVSGALPDMTSETNFYIELKKIYEKKSKEDKQNLLSIIEQTTNKLNLKDYYVIITNKNFNILDIVCKNWSQMSLFSYSTYETSLPDVSEINFYDNTEKSNFIWYILTKASDCFYDKFSKYPVYLSNKEEYDDVKSNFILVLEEYLRDADYEMMNDVDFKTISGEYLDEFIRNSQLFIPSAVSIIGSICSQEIIKLITCCFETINNSLIFNCIDVSSSVYNMKTNN